MASKLNPYLHFVDNAKEAMEFYHGVFGGELTMNTFGQGGVPMHDPADADRIMHAQLLGPSGMTLMGADTPTGWTHTPGTSVSMSLSGEDEAELKSYWDKLSEGATVQQPLTAAPWGDTFGMLVDKFGTRWMVNIVAKKA